MKRPASVKARSTDQAGSRRLEYGGQRRRLLQDGAIQDWWHADDAEDARAILDRRYASGELTPERYEAVQAELGIEEANRA